MTPGDVWLAGFAALVIVCAATVLLRCEPTLVRGGTIFFLSALYVALAVSASLAPWWFVLGGSSTAVIAIMEECFKRVCARYERSNTGFLMTVPGGGLHIRLHDLSPARVTALSFRARPAHRKGDLFLRLLRKQYQGVLPTIRIRMG